MAMHALYRFYDAGGDLLYVGITNNPSRRWGRHAEDKPWWIEVDRIEIERHPDRPSVLIAERDAIKAELPRYNVVHAPAPASAPAEAGPQPQACECGAAAQYVYVLHREIHEHESWWAKYRGGYSGADSWKPRDLRPFLIDFADILAAPLRAPWRFACEAHVPEDENPYGFECPTTWAGWMRKSAHLLDTKDWIVHTTWGGTLAKLANGWEGGIMSELDKLSGAVLDVVKAHGGSEDIADAECLLAELDRRGAAIERVQQACAVLLGTGDGRAAVAKLVLYLLDDAPGTCRCAQRQ